MFMAQLAHVMPATGSVILSSDIYRNLLVIFKFFSRTFFTTKGTKFTKSFYRRSLKVFLCTLRALCGLSTYLVIPRNRNSRRAPTGFYGLGVPLNNKPGIVQIFFIINQRF